MAMGLSLGLVIPTGFGVDVGPVLTMSNIGWQFSLAAIALVALHTPVRA